MWGDARGTDVCGTTLDAGWRGTPLAGWMAPRAPQNACPRGAEARGQWTLHGAEHSPRAERLSQCPAGPPPGPPARALHNGAA